MSSPFGTLDVREYGYSIQEFTVPDGATYTMSTGGVWLVSKILGAVLATGPSSGIINIDGQTSTVEKGGCVTLTPGGAYRHNIVLLGEGLYVLVEFWWQANKTGTPPVVVIT